MPVEVKPKKQILPVKITLVGTKPSIWRRVQVYDDLSLQQLHQVIQSTMAWLDHHLHQFRAGNKRFGAADLDDADVIDETKTGIKELLGTVGNKARYTYDFGDNWEHDLLLEKVLEPQPALTYPRCTDGRRAARR